MEATKLEAVRKMLKEKEEEVFRLRELVAELEAKRDFEHQPNIYQRSLPVPSEHKRERGFGISAEPHTLKTVTEASLKTYLKADKTTDLINGAIQDNAFLRNLGPNQIREIVACMRPLDIETDETIIREGNEESLVYVIEEGEVEISQEGRKLSTLTSGKMFGELAILHNCVRTASAKALTRCKLWAIERRDFQTIMLSAALKKQKQYSNFLSSVPAFKELSTYTLSRIADVLEEIHYENGDYIIRQNMPGDTFYIISKGKVKVTQEKPDSLETSFLRELETGEFFGERALETEELRSANIIANDPSGVTCLVLERYAYKALISQAALLRKDEWNNDKKKIEELSKKIEELSGQERDEFANVALTDLKFIATLGVGGFGRVELVHIGNDTKRSFALKKLKKQHIVATCQQVHMMNEKKVLMEIHCDFIIRLYITFKDKKYLYMLFEAALGGELWSLLRDKGSFDVGTARFYSACVTEALDYMHSRGIIYRDLKPENLVLDSTGYVKLIDFGFAKEIGVAGKTYTFCGTPDYVAPEIIMNKGHGLAADLWSFGILVYELLAGRAPFTGSDQAKTYNLILRGIHSVDFPRSFNNTAIKFIRQLCRFNPSDRLGYDYGMKLIQKHTWFEGFNWDGLRKRTMKAPYIPKVESAADTSNFDPYPTDGKIPPDDETGWDKDF